jgi:hypothetical protein
MGVTPPTSLPNQQLRSRGNGQNDSVWGNATQRIVVPYPVPVVAVADGATNYLQAFDFPVPFSSKVVLVGVSVYCRAGSCTIDIDQNGSAIPGLESLSVTSTPTFYAPTDVTNVADGDLFAPVVDSV